MDRHKHQCRREAGEKICLFAHSAPRYPKSRAGNNKYAEEENQANRSSLSENLDIVVVRVLGLVVERLHAFDRVLKAAHAKAHQRAAAEQLQAVREEHKTLNGVFVCQKAL